MRRASLGTLIGVPAVWVAVLIGTTLSTGPVVT